MTREQQKIVAIVIVVLLGGSAVSIYKKYFKTLSSDYVKTTPYVPTSNILPKRVMSYKRTSVVLIQIAGAVKEPGVYRVNSNARVIDVISVAGGIMPGADLNKINMAAVVKDGKQIKIPFLKKKHVKRKKTRQVALKRRININLANKKELTSIPGIGNSTALAIIKLRVIKGEIKGKEDLLTVKGIGNTKIKKIEKYIIY